MGKEQTNRLVRQFRKEPTPTEAALWECLRDRRLAGLKFRRQHPLGGYVPDFYCPRSRLVVEFDGPVHEDFDQREYDRLRDEELSSRGLTVIRFTNAEVETDLERVLGKIVEAAPGRKAVKRASPRPSATPLHCKSGNREGPANESGYGVPHAEERAVNP